MQASSKSDRFTIIGTAVVALCRADHIVGVVNRPAEEGATVIRIADWLKYVPKDVIAASLLEARFSDDEIVDFLMLIGD